MFYAFASSLNSDNNQFICEKVNSNNALFLDLANLFQYNN